MVGARGCSIVGGSSAMKRVVRVLFVRAAFVVPMIFAVCFSPCQCESRVSNAQEFMDAFGSNLKRNNAAVGTILFILCLDCHCIFFFD